MRHSLELPANRPLAEIGVVRALATPSQGFLRQKRQK